MKKTQNLVSIYLLVISVFITAAVTMRTVAFLNEFNPQTGYFGKETLLSVANWITMIGCIFSATALITHKKMPKLKQNFQSPLVYVPAGAVSVALAFFAGTTIHTAVTRTGVFESSEAFFASDTLLMLALAVLAVVSIAYFMLCNVFESHRSPERGAFGLVLVIFFALCAVQMYFSKDMPINSQIKTIDQLAFSFTAVFFLFETRLSLDRDIWSGYIAFGGISATLCAYSAIPAIIYYFVKGEVAAAPIAQSVLLLTVFALIMARLFLILRLPVDKMCETAEAVMLMSEARSAQLEAAKNIRAHAVLKNEENDAEKPQEESDDGNYAINLDQLDITNIENGDI